MTCRWILDKTDLAPGYNAGIVILHIGVGQLRDVVIQGVRKFKFNLKESAVILS